MSTRIKTGLSNSRASACLQAKRVSGIGLDQGQPADDQLDLNNRFESLEVGTTQEDYPTSSQQISDKFLEDPDD